MSDRLLEVADICPLHRLRTDEVRADTALQDDGDVSGVAAGM
ncbi:hypothetical protein [Xanthomonas euroxanthea]|uniref:Uncharacterized protein n=1 Tax=Xanthomonas euroxanthea TaxID=2259622 RepID=A0AA46CAQ7_9XANT|nr:hypothetical protein [Xanthomonas euroxanthea]SUZ29284.1 hypothetical protein CPBF424_31220 [Xanthomonas euroxanthea]